MLALLPDNTAGDISPADLRAIVTDLYNAAHTIGSTSTYDWTDDQTPAAGKVSLNQGWQTFSTTMNLSERTAEGGTLSFTAIDAGPIRLIFYPASGGHLKLDTTGPSTDQGGFRSVPIQVIEFAGGPPPNNDPMTSLFMVLAT